MHAGFQNLFEQHVDGALHSAFGVK